MIEKIFDFNRRFSPLPKLLRLTLSRTVGNPRPLIWIGKVHATKEVLELTGQ